jgi:hypothetical protein
MKSVTVSVLRFVFCAYVSCVCVFECVCVWHGDACIHEVYRLHIHLVYKLLMLYCCFTATPHGDACIHIVYRLHMHKRICKEGTCP